MSGDQERGGGAVGLAAVLVGVLGAGAALLLVLTPAAPAAGTPVLPAATGGSGCAGEPGHGALFGLVCPDAP